MSKKIKIITIIDPVILYSRYTINRAIGVISTVKWNCEYRKGPKIECGDVEIK